MITWKQENEREKGKENPNFRATSPLANGESSPNPEEQQNNGEDMHSGTDTDEELYEPERYNPDQSFDTHNRLGFSVPFFLFCYLNLLLKSH